jgi:2-polyprenyl-6-methoxyphenol hydroxylase-like FAD-dependent oxidoreductase
VVQAVDISGRMVWFQTAGGDNLCVKYDLLVAADGANSAVQEALATTGAISYTRVYPRCPFPFSRVFRWIQNSNKLNGFGGLITEVVLAKLVRIPVPAVTRLPNKDTEVSNAPERWRGARNLVDGGSPCRWS